VKVDLNSFKDFSVDDDNSDDEAVDPASSLIPAYEDLEASVASTKSRLLTQMAARVRNLTPYSKELKKTNGKNRVLSLSMSKTACLSRSRILRLREDWNTSIRPRYEVHCTFS
jgi:hypothetical protein